MRRYVTKRSTGAFLPNQVGKAYNFPAGGETLPNQTIAFLELGGGFKPQDVYNYCDTNGFARPQITVLGVDGVTNTESGASGADGEVNLDICVAAAVAPGVKILMIFSDNSEQGFANGILAAANHPSNPCALSISWGVNEENWTVSGRAAVDAALQACLAKGMQVFAASGDNGSTDGVSDGQAHCDYPASSPFSIGCGGTNLTINADGSIATQTAWTTNGATGGGVSTCYAKPAWQTVAQLGAHAGRMVPDISGNADPATGYNVEDDGGMYVFGGTSAVAPLYAALCALITSRLDKTVTNWKEIIYNNNVCVDVVGGNNGNYECVVGYDLCTGMGSVDGTKMLNALATTNNLTVLPVASNPPAPVAPVPHKSLWQKILALLGL